MKKQLKQNNKVVYEMYNKYRYLLEELDLYKNHLIEQITDIKENDEELLGDVDNKDLDSIINNEENFSELTQQQKDFKFYLLAKELKMTRWNSTLEGQVLILKQNNVQNNAHIREQTHKVKYMDERMDAIEENAKALRESLKDHKNETKAKFLNLPVDNGVGQIIKNGELDPHNDLVLKLLHHIKIKIFSELDEMEKSKSDPFDQKKFDAKFISIEHEMNEIIMKIGDKADRSYTDTLEASLRELIDNVRTKTSIKINSLEELADNETLNSIFSSLIDRRYTDYEKSLAKVYSKMDKLDGDLEK